MSTTSPANMRANMVRRKFPIRARFQVFLARCGCCTGSAGSAVWGAPLVASLQRRPLGVACWTRSAGGGSIALDTFALPILAAVRCSGSGLPMEIVYSISPFSGSLAQKCRVWLEVSVLRGFFIFSPHISTARYRVMLGTVSSSTGHITLPTRQPREPKPCHSHDRYALGDWSSEFVPFGFGLFGLFGSFGSFG